MFATKAGNTVDFNEISGNFQQTEKHLFVLRTTALLGPSRRVQ